MPNLKEGDLAPAINARDENGKTITLAEFRGKKVVLYFYPKDNTPGCTAEACDLRDHYAQFQKEGFEIIGVSADSERSHQNFIKKYELPFRLISDEDHQVLKAYGSWGEKKMYGKTYMGIVRSAFMVDENGEIAATAYKISPKNTVPTLMQWLA